VPLPLPPTTCRDPRSDVPTVGGSTFGFFSWCPSIVRACSGSDDQSIRLWNAQSGEHLQKLPTAAVNCVQLVRSSRALVARTTAGQIDGLGVMQSCAHTINGTVLCRTEGSHERCTATCDIHHTPCHMPHEMCACATDAPLPQSDNSAP
jgi:WD40 repeat protein